MGFVQAAVDCVPRAACEGSNGAAPGGSSQMICSQVFGGNRFRVYRNKKKKTGCTPSPLHTRTHTPEWMGSVCVCVCVSVRQPWQMLLVKEFVFKVGWLHTDPVIRPLRLIIVIMNGPDRTVILWPAHSFCWRGVAVQYSRLLQWVLLE